MEKEAYLAKATECLKVAHWCFEEGCPNSCVNRCYFAMFQAAVAALIDAGVRPSKNIWRHDWVQAEFSRQLIKRSKIYPSVLRTYLQDALTHRNGADYSSLPISQRDAAVELK